MLRLKSGLVVSASLIFSGSAFGQPAAIDLISQIKSGQVYGGLTEFTISSNDAARVGAKLKSVRQTNGTFAISRAQDVDQQTCLANAGAQWVAQVESRGATASIPPATIANTKLSDILKCNAAWHAKIADVAKAVHFQMLEATVADGDASIRSGLNRTLAYVDVDSIKYSKGVITQGNAQAGLTRQFNAVVTNNTALTKAI